MTSAGAFRPMGASIFESPQREVIVAKQSIMATYGHEVRGLLAQLDSDLTKSMLGVYQEIEKEVISEVEASMIERELNIVIDDNTFDNGLNTSNQNRLQAVGIEPDNWDTPAP